MYNNLNSITSKFVHEITPSDEHQIYTFIYTSTIGSKKDHKLFKTAIRLGVLELLVGRELADVVLCFEDSIVLVAEPGVVRSGTVVEH